MQISTPARTRRTIAAEVRFNGYCRRFASLRQARLFARSIRSGACAPQVRRLP